MRAQRLKHWGWGYEERFPSLENLRGAGALAHACTSTPYQRTRHAYGRAYPGVLLDRA